jgi:hypothetical protein
MSEGPYQVLLFESVSAALLAEKILKKKGVPHKIIPVPRHLSSDCGVCIRIRESTLQQAMESLEGRVKVSATHKLSQT